MVSGSPVAPFGPICSPTCLCQHSPQVSLSCLWGLPGRGVVVHSVRTYGVSVAVQHKPLLLLALLSGGDVRARLPETPRPALRLLPPGTGADRERHRLGAWRRGSKVSSLAQVPLHVCVEVMVIPPGGGRMVVSGHKDTLGA
jgi:hypothetical protein